MNTSYIVYSFADIYSSCVYFFRTLKDAAMSIHVRFCADVFSFLLGIYLNVELLGHVTVYFQALQNHLSIAAILFYLLPSNAGGSLHPAALSW